MMQYRNKLSKTDEDREITENNKQNNSRGSPVNLIEILIFAENLYWQGK